MGVVQTVLLPAVALLAGLLTGAVVGCFWTVRRCGVDAEQRRRRRSAELADRVVQVADTGVAVVDANRDVIVTNPRAAELGLVRDDLLDDRAWVAAARVLDTGGPVDCDLTAEHPLPGRGRIAVRCRARSLGPDQPGLVVLFADDDSEQVRMEATRRDFVANVSHELKTPLGALSLLAEALLESADDPDSVRHFGGRMQTEAFRLGSMVSELIALSRLQGAEKLPDPEPVDVDDVVELAVDRSRTAAEVGGIQVTTDRASGLQVLGDRTLLVTALTNLVANAIVYSPAGSHVSISRALRGGMVTVSVTDRGIGIAKRDQERVFERFFRVDQARSRATGGTGLGLAIVKHVAANHNGSIRLWSKPGTGSTFTLSIPSYLQTEPAYDSGFDAEASDPVISQGEEQHIR